MSTQTADQTPTQTAPRASIMDKCVCLSVTRGKFGNTRKAATSHIEIENDEDGIKADKSMVALRKRLLASPELAAIGRLDSEIRTYLDTIALPSMFRSGVYLVPHAMAAELVAGLKAFKARRAALVDAFVSAYPAQALAVKQSLGVLYNPRDYPATDRLRASFYFEWEFVTFGVPGTLKQISEAIFKEETDKAATRASEAVEAIRASMRAMLKELTDHMVERLTGDDPKTGKKKVFRDSLVKNMNDFLSTFDLRNVANDAELSALVQKARDAVSGVDPKSLRSDEALRDAVAKSLSDVKSVLDTMVTERTRTITFDDELDSVAD